MILRTCLAILWILSSSVALTGCSLFEKKSQPLTQHTGPLSQVYVSGYEEIWRAVQKSLIKYPIRINNIDEGIIETEELKARDHYTPPAPLKPPSPGMRYRLRVQVLRGEPTRDGQEKVQVRVYKNQMLERDFFSGQEKVPSDGFEERSILYRIGRELQIERGLRRAFEQNKI